MEAYATILCDCGWAMCGTNGDQLYCDNPKCPKRAQVFRLGIELTEVKLPKPV